MLEFSLSLSYAALALHLIGRWKLFAHPGFSPRFFQSLFLLKVLAALGLYFIYTQFYTERSTADVFRYYDDSAIMYDALLQKPWDYFRLLTGIRSGATDLLPYYDRMNNWYNTDMVFNDSRTMIRLNAFLRCFSVGTYFPHAVIMCFLAFTGLACIFRVMDRLAPGREVLLSLVVFLMPSTLLWTSGMIKEALLVFVMGWLFYRFSELQKHGATDALKSGLIPVFVFLLLLVKAYVFFLFIPVLIALFLKKDDFKSWSLYSLLYFLLLFGMSPFITGKSVPQLLADKQGEFFHLAELAKAGSLVQIPRLDGSWYMMLADMPGAFFRTLVLPLPGQLHHVLMYLAMAENMLIWILIVVGIVSMWKRFQASVIIASFFLFAASLFVLSGMISPVVGALVRYKVPALPFLLFVFVQAYPVEWNRIFRLPSVFRRTG